MRRDGGSVVSASERNAVQRAFDQFGEESGFEKRSASWYCRSEDVIAVSNLQKSQYGLSYYFNQGFWLRQLGAEPLPEPHRCHIRARIGQLLPSEEQQVERLFDLGHDVSDETRIEEITALLRDRLVPLIVRAGSLDGLRALISEGAIPAYLLTGAAQRALG